MRLTNSRLDINKTNKRAMNSSAIQKSISITPLKISSSTMSFSRQNSQPSFKALNSVLYKTSDAVLNPGKILELFSKYMGDSAQKLLGNLTNKDHEVGKFLVGRVVQDEKQIAFQEKSFFNLVTESVLYPIKDVPVLIADSFLVLGKKIPGIKGIAENAYNSKFLSEFRNKTLAEEQLNMLQGVYEKVNTLLQKRVKSQPGNKNLSGNELNKKVAEELQKLLDGDMDNKFRLELFKTASKQFSPKTGNYSTVHERTLNRIVTGLIPAWFLGNDAYNLAILYGDEKKTADKEKKARIKQEFRRVLTNAYLRLITLGAFTSFVNKSAMNSAVISSGTVLISEVTSRLSKGKAPYFISSEKAKDMNRELAKEGSANNNNNSATQADIASNNKPSVIATNIEDKKDNPTLKTIGSNESFKQNDKKAKDSSTIFSFDFLKKAALFLVGSGITLGYLRNSKRFNTLVQVYVPKNKDVAKQIITDSKLLKDAEQKVKNDAGEIVFENFGIKRQMDDFFGWLKKTFYEPITQQDFKMDEKIVREAVAKLKEANTKTGEFFEDVLKSKAVVIKDGNVIIKDNKVSTKIKPFVDMVIAPFKFIWSILNFPYNKLFKLPIKAIMEGILAKMEEGGKDITNSSLKKIMTELFGEDIKKSDNEISIFVQSMEKIVKKSNELKDGKITDEQFKNFVDALSSFNVKTQSGYSNTSLAMLTKLVESTITSVFLVSDNYNMIMLKSNGEDKEGAKQKAQERVVQRLSGIFYQTMFMNWFNTVFETMYHTSLGGMAWVNTMNTFATEFFTRFSIGMPINAKSYDELVAIEEKNNNRKGALGAYFRFMTKLTGKKALTKKTKTVQSSVAVNNTNPLNSSVQTDNHTTNLLELYSAKKA